MWKHASSQISRKYFSRKSGGRRGQGPRGPKCSHPLDARQVAATSRASHLPGNRRGISRSPGTIFGRASPTWTPRLDIIDAGHARQGDHTIRSREGDQCPPREWPRVHCPILAANEARKGFRFADAERKSLQGLRGEKKGARAGTQRWLTLGHARLAGTSLEATNNTATGNRSDLSRFLPSSSLGLQQKPPS